MGNLAEDTAVTPAADGSWTAELGRDWEIWGPNGGYVAAVALRAAGAHSGQPRPVSFSCHYLGVASFGDVQVQTVTLRATKRAESIRVSMTQDRAPVLEALVWTAEAGMTALSHDAAPTPDVPRPADLPSVDELLTPEQRASGHGFWRNFDEKPTRWVPPEEWERRPAGEPDLHTWLRFRPAATFADPFVDAGRLLVLLDTFQWPAATRAYAAGSLAHIAPSMDLWAAFHRLDPASEWLLATARSPVADDGLVGGQAAVWSEHGRLLATGGQQMLCRPVPMAAAGS